MINMQNWYKEPGNWQFYQPTWTVMDSFTNEEESVNHPKHYTSHPSGVECITITEHYNFCIGNAIKYLWRAGLKSDASLQDTEKEIQDLEKSIWYIKRHIENLRKNVS